MQNSYVFQWDQANYLVSSSELIVQLGSTLILASVKTHKQHIVKSLVKCFCYQLNSPGYWHWSSVLQDLIESSCNYFLRACTAFHTVELDYDQVTKETWSSRANQSCDHGPPASLSLSLSSNDHIHSLWQNQLQKPSLHLQDCFSSSE